MAARRGRRATAVSEKVATAGMGQRAAIRFRGAGFRKPNAVACWWLFALTADGFLA